MKPHEIVRLQMAAVLVALAAALVPSACSAPPQDAPDMEISDGSNHWCLHRPDVGWLCAPPAVDPYTAPQPATTAHAGLRAATSCSDLASIPKDVWVQKMRAELHANLATAQTANCAPCYDPPAYSADAGTVVGPPAGNQGASSYSQTNVQVQGVDEPDFVKNDGRFLYQARPDGKLAILQAWPAAQTKVVSVLDVGSPVQKLFLAGDRVVAFSYSTSTYGRSCTYGYDCEFVGEGGAVTVSVVDVSNRATPFLQRQIDVPAGYLSARRIGDFVHLVAVGGESADPLAFLPRWPAGVRSAPPECGMAGPREVLDPAEIARRFAELEAQNLAAIDQYVADFSAPWGSVVDRRFAAGQPAGTVTAPIGCSDIQVSEVGDGQSLLSVLSFAISDLQPVSLTSMFSRPGAVYGSAQALYVGVRHSRSDAAAWYSGTGSDDVTAVHKFQIQPDGRGVRYAASGLVPGRVLNQFAMDEKDNRLRVATSIGWMVSSTLTVLEEKAGALEAVGKLEGIAPGEDIRAVRFDGDTGYVVTFKKTDPLFVIDLSDPVRPAIEGELQVPGFSTYIHKLDATHLLTIGFDAQDEGSFAWYQGILLQIFDVAEKTAPALLHKEVIGTRGSGSEAATNHLAFNYYAPLGILAIPVTQCEGGYGSMPGDWTRFNGLLVYDVSVATGFAKRGGIPFPVTGYCGYWWSESTSDVKRSAILEDFVFAIAPDEVKVSALADLANPVADVMLAY